MALNQFMHPRNRYRNHKPDFAKLAQDYPEFKRHLSTTLTGKVSLDFRDPEALRALTCTLLKEDFGIDLEIPLDRIIPTVPLRLNYILWIEDLLKQSGHDGSGEIYGIDVGKKQQKNKKSQLSCVNKFGGFIWRHIICCVTGM